MILAVCDRFHCTPSQAGQEEAGIIRLLKIESLGKKQEEVAEA